MGPSPRKIVIFDLDGTIADISHRQVHVISKPKNWKKFHEGVERDLPYHDIIRLAKILAVHYPLFICSGRDGGSYTKTLEWLKEHDADVFDEVHLRDPRDHRPDTELKLEMLDNILARGFEVEFVFEDRTRVVDAWRSRGIRCFQVAPGDF